MKIKLVDTQPTDPREFDLPEKFSPKNLEDIAEIFENKRLANNLPASEPT